MNEEFLWYLWKYQLFSKDLKTTAGQPVEVIQAGTHNTDSGPDFFNGRIRIDGTVWAGNIEVHVRSSDWQKHKHNDDPAYESIILHVVYEDDHPLITNQRGKIPTITLKNGFDPSLYQRYHSFILSESWIACEKQVRPMNSIYLTNWLQRVMVERLETKSESILALYREAGSDFIEAFYRRLLRNFGFRTNGPAFESLAVSVPFNILSKHINNLKQLEALLFGQAGLLRDSFRDKYPVELLREYQFLREKYKLIPLNNGTIRFLRMRPPNFPTIRLSQFANLMWKTTGLLHSILEAKRLKQVSELLRCEASPYWVTHYRFDKVAGRNAKIMGKHSVDLILINTIIPYLFVYGKLNNSESLQGKAIDWLEEIPPEKNAIIKRFKQIGIISHNAMESQALIQLKSTYCDHKKCLSCGIGRELLNPDHVGKGHRLSHLPG